MGEHVDGLGRGLAHRSDLISAPQSRRVQHIGAGPLVGHQAGDGVVEVGVPANVILGSRGERERKAQTLGRLGGRRHSLHRVVELVDPALGVVVLDRPPDGPGLGDPGDGQRGVLGLGRVAILQIDGDWKARCLIERPGVLDDLIERGIPVQAPQRERKAGAGARQGLEPERRQDPGRPGVPRVRNDEGRALVQGAELCGFLILRRLQGDLL